MSSRRPQLRAAILVSKKVLFTGRWHTNEVTDDILQHLRRNLPMVPSQKAKLKLSELGIFFGKRVVLGRSHDEFIPMERIIQIVQDSVYTTVLLCLIKSGTKSVFDILVFRCLNEMDARESVEVFRRLRALTQGSPAGNTATTQISTRTTNGGDFIGNGGQMMTNGRIVDGTNLNKQSKQIGLSIEQRQQLLHLQQLAQKGMLTVEQRQQLQYLQQLQRQQELIINQQLGSEEQEEAILVVTPDPGAMSPNIDEPIIIQGRGRNGNGVAISHQYRRLDESDAAFKRRMRREFGIESDTADSYMADCELDQVSLADSITAQQRALNDKVSYIAEEVNRLRSVFESTLRTGNGATNGGDARYTTSSNNLLLLNGNGRRTSSERSRSRSRSPGQHDNNGAAYYSSSHNVYHHRDESPGYMHSPPLAPGETYRRRQIVSDSTHQIQQQQGSPSMGGARSRRLAYVYRQSTEPDVLYVHTVRGNNAVSRGSVNDLLAVGASPSRVNGRRGSGNPPAPLVRVTVPQPQTTTMRSAHSVNLAAFNNGNSGGAMSSKISRQRKLAARSGIMQRSRSSQMLAGTLAQTVSSNDFERVGSPEDDERIRRQREVAERIRSSAHSQERREIVRAQMGVVEREKWELAAEPLYLLRSDNRPHQDRGVKLYKTRSVPNFLATSAGPPSQSATTSNNIKYQTNNGNSNSGNNSNANNNQSNGGQQNGGQQLSSAQRSVNERQERQETSAGAYSYQHQQQIVAGA